MIPNLPSLHIIISTAMFLIDLLCWKYATVLSWRKHYFVWVWLSFFPIYFIMLRCLMKTFWQHGPISREILVGWERDLAYGTHHSFLYTVVYFLVRGNITNSQTPQHKLYNWQIFGIFEKVKITQFKIFSRNYSTCKMYLRVSFTSPNNI